MTDQSSQCACYHLRQGHAGGPADTHCFFCHCRKFRPRWEDGEDGGRPRDQL
jgi:hypothetical protein